VADAGLKGRLAAQVFGSFALGYAMSYALRSVNAVAAPALQAEFGLSNAQLGSLTAAYFLGFSLMQLPLGVWLDRFGARPTHAVLLVVATVGCAIYAAAPSSTALWIGRLLIGIGVSGALMAAMKGYRFWFGDARQQPLVALMLVAGSAGALSSTVPVEWMVRVAGWRSVFWLAAVLLGIAAIAVWCLLPRDEEQVRGRSTQGLWAGYGEVFGNRVFWHFGVISILLHAGFIALQSLWAGPWLREVVGLSTTHAAQVLLLFNFVLLIGFLVLGAIVSRVQVTARSMQRVVVLTCAAMLLGEGLILSDQSASAWIWWVLLAAASIPFTMIQTYVSTRFPLELTGRAYTAYNLLLFAAVFAEQWVLGVAIDVARDAGFDTAQAMRVSLAGFMVLQSFGVAWFMFNRRSFLLDERQ
jgi:predicted MFS family arabinose efflux permease